MRNHARVLSASCLAAALVLGTAASGAAQPLAAADPVIVGRDLSSGAVAPSPYVEASSPEEADAILDALESGSTTQAQAASVSYGPCVLYPSVVYLRASSNYGAVGAKPYTKCSQAVASIRHETDLRYKSFIWWKLAVSKGGGNSGVASYTQKNVEYYCVSTEESGWSGTTAGTIVSGGRTYYARVYQEAKSLKCGG